MWARAAIYDGASTFKRIIAFSFEFHSLTISDNVRKPRPKQKLK